MGVDELVGRRRLLNETIGESCVADAKGKEKKVKEGRGHIRHR